MVERGREPGLQLRVDEENTGFAEVAGRLLAEMAEIAVLLDQAHQTTLYSDAIREQQLKLAQPEHTYAARVLDAMIGARQQLLCLWQGGGGGTPRPCSGSARSARNGKPCSTGSPAESLQAQATLEASDTIGF
jgi:glutamate--cysteine ligase